MIDDKSGLIARAFNRLQHWMLSSRLKYPFLLCWGQFGGFFPVFATQGKHLQVAFGDPIRCVKLSPADPLFDGYVVYITNEYYNQQNALAGKFASSSSSSSSSKEGEKRGIKKE